MIGCLKYGAGLCGMSSLQRSLTVHLREHSIMAGPDDAAFLNSLEALPGECQRGLPSRCSCRNFLSRLMAKML